MIPHSYSRPVQPLPELDYLTLDIVTAELGENTARRLSRHTDLVALDGWPCWDAEQLDDLLGLLAAGGAV